MLRLRGVTTSDSILNLFPLTRYPHGAFARAMNAAAALNIPVVAALPGHVNERRPEIGSQLDEVIAIAARSRATILWGVPTFIRKMVARAEELNVKLPTVRLVFVTGEGFGEAARTDLTDRLRRLGAVRHSSAFPMAPQKCRAAWWSARPAPATTTPRPINFCSRPSTRRATRLLPMAKRA